MNIVLKHQRQQAFFHDRHPLSGILSRQTTITRHSFKTDTHYQALFQDKAPTIRHAFKTDTHYQALLQDRQPLSPLCGCAANAGARGAIRSAHERVDVKNHIVSHAVCTDRRAGRVFCSSNPRSLSYAVEYCAKRLLVMLRAYLVLLAKSQSGLSP